MISWENRALFSIAVVFIAAVVSTPLFGQGAGTASISGRVTDASNAAVPSASVVVKNTATSASQTTVSDDQGRYTVPDLPIGSYEIQASKAGLSNTLRSGITLSVGSAPVIDFQLKVGQATETVNVSAEASQVETTNASVSSLVN